MKFEPRKRESRAVAKPPPEAMQRVDGGGAWGPTQFELPPSEGKNTVAVLVTALVGGLVVLAIVGLGALAYFELR